MFRVFRPSFEVVREGRILNRIKQPGTLIEAISLHHLFKFKQIKEFDDLSPLMKTNRLKTSMIVGFLFSSKLLAFVISQDCIILTRDS